MENKKTLYRDTDNKMLGGVASGLADYMGWDVTLVRLVFVFCLFAVQGSFLAYLLAWLIIPKKGCPSKPLGVGVWMLLILICIFPALLAAMIGFFFFCMFAAF